VYGIIGEDESDARTLKELVHCLANDRSLKIKTKGFEGCGQMLRRGAGQIKLFAQLGLTRFIVAYDADGHDPRDRYDEVMAKVIRPSGVQTGYCVLIPVQEIEAWILADIESVSNVFSSWHPDPITQDPEKIENPKEFLEKRSRDSRKRPVYDHSTHNEKVARHLNLEIVRKRCPSFAPLVKFVTQ
jgi:hypothetical protein